MTGERPAPGRRLGPLATRAAHRRHGGPIRVALDVSALVRALHEGSPPFGIRHAISEWLGHASQDERLAVTPLSVCSSDPLRSSLTAERILWRELAPSTPSPAFVSRFGLRTRWRAAFDELEAAERRGTRARLAAARGRTAFLKRVDAVPSWQRHGYDVFHSTFDALPPPAATRGAVRLLSVYDVIPLTDPDTAALDGPRAALLGIVASIDDSAHVVVNSTHVAGEVQRVVGVPPERVHVVPLGAASTFYDVPAAVQEAARSVAGIGDHGFVLAVAGGQARKNVKLLIRAFARIANEPGVEDARLVLVGVQWLGPDRIAEELDRHPAIRSRVVRLEAIHKDVLRGLYAAATVFVQPSRDEGFGLPLAEAMAAGSPVVAADASSLPEVLGGAGRLVDVDDDRQLSSILLEILTDESARSALRETSAARGRQLTWRASSDRLAALYEELAR